MRAVKSPMMATTVWPSSWKARSTSRTARWPMCMSGAVGSSPSLIRSFSPRSSRARRWSATWISTARSWSISHNRTEGEAPLPRPLPSEWGGEPLAPTTPRSLPKAGAVLPAQLPADRLQLRVDLDVGQGSLVATEGEREGHALVAFGDLAAPVLVEGAHGLEQRTPSLLDRGLEPPGPD